MWSASSSRPADVETAAEAHAHLKGAAAALKEAGEKLRHGMERVVPPAVPAMPEGQHKEGSEASGSFPITPSLMSALSANVQALRDLKANLQGPGKEGLADSIPGWHQVIGAIDATLEALSRRSDEAHMGPPGAARGSAGAQSGSPGEVPQEWGPTLEAAIRVCLLWAQSAQKQSQAAEEAGGGGHNVRGVNPPGDGSAGGGYGSQALASLTPHSARSSHATGVLFRWRGNEEESLLSWRASCRCWTCVPQQYKRCRCGTCTCTRRRQNWRMSCWPSWLGSPGRASALPSPLTIQLPKGGGGKWEEAEGTGMGEGVGGKDVSDQLTDEDQLLGSRQKDLPPEKEEEGPARR
eukprot:jgi/Botrbrau1/196/Bobra.0022s0176.1